MKRSVLRRRFSEAISDIEEEHGALPGIAAAGRKEAFVRQLVDSERRNLFFAALVDSSIGEECTKPTGGAFDPLRAALWFDRAGQRDEAFWMVFLFVHFGKSKHSGWSQISDVYGALGREEVWSWDAVASDIGGFRDWLDENESTIRSLEPRRTFGNHRKYESLNAWSRGGTGSVVEGYVGWVGADGHDARVGIATESAKTAIERFDALYRSVRSVPRFGRIAAFDYCGTLVKLGLVSAEPGAAYLEGSTGPLRGAQMLLASDGAALPPAVFEARLAPIRRGLGVSFDVLEDALCNWQKSPDIFKPFRA